MPNIKWWDLTLPPINLWNAPKMKYDDLKPLNLEEVTARIKQEIATNVNTTTSGVNEIQFGGSHYKGKAIQPWDYVVANNLGYLEGSIIKYVSRYKDKNGVEDLYKARHFLDKLIEVTVEGK